MSKHSTGWVSEFDELIRQGKYEHLHQLSGWKDIEDPKVWEAFVLDAIRNVVQPGDQIFEAGCGTLGFLKVVSDNIPGVDIYGIDASEEAIANIQKLESKKIRPEHFVQGYIPSDLGNIPSNTYDVVVCNSVLQYLPDYDIAEHTIKELLRIVKPTGKVLITDVCDEKYKRKNERKMRALWKGYGGEEYPNFLYFTKRWFSKFVLNTKKSTFRSKVASYHRAVERFNVVISKTDWLALNGLDRKLKILKRFAQVAAAVVLGITLWGTICYTKDVATFEEKSINAKADTLCHYVHKSATELKKNLNGKFSEIERLTNLIKSKVEVIYAEHPPGSDETKQLIEQTLYEVWLNNKDIFGMGICYDPLVKINGDSLEPYAPFWYRPYGLAVAQQDSGVLHQLHLDKDSNDRPYDYWKTHVGAGDWYRDILSEETKGIKWVEPYFGERAQAYLFEYGRWLTYEGNKIGIIYVDQANDILSEARVGETSHSYITSSNGQVLYYDNDPKARGSRTDLREIAKVQKDKGNLLKFCNSIVCNQDLKTSSGMIQYVDQSLGEVSQWRIYEKFEVKGFQPFTMALIYNVSDIEFGWKDQFTNTLLLIVSCAGLLLALCYLIINPPFLKGQWFKWQNSIWNYSMCATAVLGSSLVSTLVVVDCMAPMISSEEQNRNSVQVHEYPGVVNYLKSDLGVQTKYAGKSTNYIDSLRQALANTKFDTLVGQYQKARNNRPPDSLTQDSIRSTIGPQKLEDQVIQTEQDLFQIELQLNTYELRDASNAHVTGTANIKYPVEPNSGKLKPDTPGTPNFYFPDAVEQEIKLIKAEPYCVPIKVLHGEDTVPRVMTESWQFSVTLQQNLDFSVYPFDTKHLCLRIQHKDNRHQFFIPDFDSYYNRWKVQEARYYEDDSIDDRERKHLNRIHEGLHQDLYIPEWEFNGAGFEVGPSEALYHNGNELECLTPQLMHVIQAKRLLSGPMISNFLPLLLIAIIIFISLLQLRNLEMGGVIGTAVALIFSLLLSHYQLRDELQFHSIVYIEYYYFILYVALMFFVVNKYLFLSDKKYIILDYKDNLIAKVTYWPVLLGTMFIFTACFFFQHYSNFPQ